MWVQESDMQGGHRKKVLDEMSYVKADGIGIKRLADQPRNMIKAGRKASQRASGGIVQ